MIDAKQAGILNAIKFVLADLYIPAVSKASDWGELSGRESLPSKTKFLTSLESFVEVLNGAQDSLEDAVSLSPCEDVDLSKFSSPSSYSAAATSSDFLEAVERQAMIWMKQIEQVIYCLLILRGSRIWKINLIICVNNLKI